MDLSDDAQELAERERAAAVERVRDLTRGEGRDTCQMCGEMIDAARRRVMPNAASCFQCQEQLERFRRMRRR